MRDRVTVDSNAFARDAGELRGARAVADLTRLHDALFDQSGEIAYRLTGAVNKDGVATLRLEIAAELSMICQRCLGPVKFSLKASRNFELVPDMGDLGDPAAEPDEVERIHADAKLDVEALVEDEAILCLPMVAGHKPGACLSPAVLDGKNEKPSPFISLATLKRQ